MSSKNCHVVDEYSGRIVFSAETVKECEDYIANVLVPTQKKKVELGGFGIDAPEKKVNPRKK